MSQTGPAGLHSRSSAWVPGSDVIADIRGRLAVYADDWQDGWRAGTKILAPSTYIFLASLLPALAFGLQLDQDTRGTLGVVHVLAATAMTGVLQALVGGQPLLIVGVAEPIVIIYGFMYEFAKGQSGLGAGRFLPWAAWVCVWTAAMVALLALGNACRGVAAFTRFSGEVFGALIGVLFLQQAVKGLIANFRVEYSSESPTAGAPPPTADSYEWRLVNGLWSLLLALGLFASALVVVRARRWRFLRARLRGFLADYGPPAMVLVWSAASFIISFSNGGAAPPGVPRRVSSGDVWDATGDSGGGGGGGGGTKTWHVARRMAEVPGGYIAAALIPALVITVLFYFDHSVSSLMAQQPEYNLARPPAYAWDLLLLSGMTLLCGLLGLPPVNGVLPQAPMHTRSLATLGSRVARGRGGGGSTAAVDDAERKGVVEDGGRGVGEEQQATGQQQQQQGQLVHRHARGRAGVSGAEEGVEAGEVRLMVGEGGGFAAPAVGAVGGGVAGGSCVGRANGHSHDTFTSNGPPSQEGQRKLCNAAGVGVGTGPELLQSGAPSDPSVQPHAHQRERGDQDAQPQAHVAHVSAAVTLTMHVVEQRLSNLLQSLGVAACLFATPAIRQIPEAVLWGYFAFMAAESCGGSQMVDRVLLLATDPARRAALLRGPHAPYLETVPFAVTAAFTVLQVALLAGLWALVTWAGVGGIAFPVPIMALVPLRRYLLPRLFRSAHLKELDAAEYEQAPPLEPCPGSGQELVPPRLLSLLPVELTHSHPHLYSRPGSGGGSTGAFSHGGMGHVAGANGVGVAASGDAGGRGAEEVILTGSPLAGEGHGSGGEAEEEEAASAVAAAAAAVAGLEGERGVIEMEHMGSQPVHHLTRGELRQRLRLVGAAAGEEGLGATWEGGSGGPGGSGRGQHGTAGGGTGEGDVV